MTTRELPDGAALVATAETLAREAGRLVHEGRPDRVRVHATKSSPVDVVTAMDLASEELLRRRIAQLRPGDGILGEEQGYEPGTTGVTWVVDPIDGTVNYLYGLASWSVSVAAVVGTPEAGPGVAPDPQTWTALAAAVHAPADGRTFLAGRGQGATLDGAPLTVNEAKPLELSLVGTGFGYLVERRRAQAAIVAELLPLVRDIRRLGSAALDLCAVAAGGLDLYYERGLAPWDLAAGALVAQEAGAVVTGLHGRAAGPEMTVAGAPGTIEALVTFLESHRADSTA
ncbi:inositol monophosphatase family protein [Cellulomonas gelida]|uniref:Inositol-1-monophosphatase n=1 Tax=Cellulomonas gelida TaxID=1712 RepID=A0A4Y3KNI0_9CELL|nr:inositol monophosphatase family protein [Cellulomonas gelida]GEA85206.1 inositol monophosphatase [Cellulomonas gelida]GGL39493.1 inositol monophosphatase [Cellulomonas gelida]